MSRCEDALDKLREMISVVMTKGFFLIDIIADLEYS